MSPKQKNIAAKAPPLDKIDAKDFAVLKAEKAKGRGMGLQDEAIKPGKVMKAKRGVFSNMPKPFLKTNKFKDMGKFPFVKGIGKKDISKKGVLPTIDKVTPTVKGKQLPVAKNILKAAKATRYGKIALGISGAALAVKELLKSKMEKKKELKGDIKGSIAPYKTNKKMVGGMAKKYSVGGGADTGRRTYSSMAEMRAAKGFKPGETPAQFNKRKVAMEVAKKAAKATTIGKIVLPIAAAGVAGATYLKNKLKKKDKKMAGGMAKKYSVGGGAEMGERPIAAPQRRRARKDKQPRQGVKSLRELKSLRQSAGPGYLPKPADPKGKMGGGMMNKPMGYKHGTMVKARGCKLGRTRPTKMY